MPPASTMRGCAREDRQRVGQRLGAVVEHAARRCARARGAARSYVCKLVCGLRRDLSTCARARRRSGDGRWSDEDYRLEDQVGFLLRRVNQRHLAVFAGVIPEVTTTQLAALAKLAELGPLSQNQLGRATAMDAATIKGVVGRLVTRRLVATVPSAEDRRRLIVDLTPEGRALFDGLRARAREATRRTLAPLAPAERERFLALLRRLI